MAKEKPEPADLNNWILPTYNKPATEEELAQFHICRCRYTRGEHFGEELKCPFEASTFVALKSPVKK